MTALEANNPWITYAKPNPQARLRLFCFHYAGGAASAFRAWAAQLPAQIEVCPVQLPGRENRLREPLFTAVAPLIPILAAGLRPAMDMPFALFGHSMGALLSFELARYLRRQHDVQPVYLGLSGHQAPQLPDAEPPIYNLPEPEFIDRLRKFNGTPEEVLRHAELMQLVLPILRADFTLVETYSYQPDEPLACPISAFGGLQDARANRELLEGWREHTRGEFRLRMFPGDHFFLIGGRSLVLEALAQDLRAFLV